ncbi:hypothetical protein STRDD10_00507 [Streptococcus sp. DD10]|uniref:hypothetical protein n=1 Tax=Streptococcus sp. DD10 TaxID=1777878 RepID=UPI0007966011|nr:hypothetical protein [Streptococcus sp. DD10]KXT75099.1 hypothetical protein STRDD10_00507 [Streptococcus sp. DD10]
MSKEKMMIVKRGPKFWTGLVGISALLVGIAGGYGIGISQQTTNQQSTASQSVTNNSVGQQVEEKTKQSQSQSNQDQQNKTQPKQGVSQENDKNYEKDFETDNGQEGADDNRPPRREMEEDMMEADGRGAPNSNPQRQNWMQKGTPNIPEENNHVNQNR